jgi:hypothetical protein
VLLAAAGGLAFATGASAQDSVSVGGGPNGLPGDAPSAFQTTGPSLQTLNYIVDLTPRLSSWANSYALGPVLKASRSNSGGYFDQLIGAQAVSARFGYGPLFSAGSYARWVNQPGAGVNPPSNSSPASSISGAGAFGQSFGLGFMEFGAGLDGAFGTGDDENTIIGSVINSQTRVPNRLFVTRTVAAHSKAAVGSNATSSFGLGAMDEAGNLHLYADAVSLSSPSRLTARSLVRVKLGSRNSASLNNIFQAGSAPSSADLGATDFVRTSTTNMTVPGMISSRVPGGANRPLMLASDFVNNFVYESATNSTSVTTSYLPAGSSPRGSVNFVPQIYPIVNTGANDVGYATTLVRTDSNTKTRGIQVFGVSSNGAAGASLSIVLPTSSSQISDPSDGFFPGLAFAPIGNHEFTNYAGQASFRGGNGQVASVVLANGSLLVSALVAETDGGSTVPQSVDNYLAVARVPSSGGLPTWTIAAHTGGGATPAKAILGRTMPGGPLASIGRLAKYTEVYPNAATGPSISSPSMDRAGNIYFVATCSLDTLTGIPILTTGLFRANRDASTDGYQLELLARLGDVVAGANSGRNYQVQFLGLADADSVDSGSIFASSIVQDSLTGANAANAPYSSPFSLGALAFKAKIVYDTNNDGIFADPSGVGSGSTSPDEAYNTVMVLMPRVLRGDFNRDGVVTIDDIFIFLNAWFASAPAAEWDGNGAISIDDIFIFLNDWFNPNG